MARPHPKVATAALLLLLASCAAPSTRDVQPQPAPPAPGPAALSTTVLEGLAASPLHSRFAEAMRAAGTASKLASTAPNTLFAPTDEALARLPNGTLDSLRAPQSRALLGGFLEYHVVPGLKTRAQILADARAGGGTATYRTMQGGLIRVVPDGSRLSITDLHGNRVSATAPEALHADGVLYAIDGVLLPQT